MVCYSACTYSVRANWGCMTTAPPPRSPPAQWPLSSRYNVKQCVYLQRENKLGLHDHDHSPHPSQHDGHFYHVTVCYSALWCVTMCNSACTYSVRAKWGCMTMTTAPTPPSTMATFISWSRTPADSLCCRPYSKTRMLPMPYHSPGDEMQWKTHLVTG